jgi:hypothetical protein
MQRSQFKANEPLAVVTTRQSDAAGYVYVLATAYRAESGLPIVKIGMTKRTPDERVVELSRGGPVGMTLEGFVTSRDPRALERWAHQHFAASKYAGGGGTEYFAANPADILSWLGTTSPRFELDSARQSAWKEYCESMPHKQQSHITNIPMYLGGACFWADLLFWHPNIWVVGLGFPAGFAGGCLLIRFFLWSLLKRIDMRLAGVRLQLEEMYHLPPGGVRAPP